MATNTLGGVLLPRDLPPIGGFPIQSTALEAIASLFRGMSNAFVSFVADLHNANPTGSMTAKERRLYLAFLAIVVLLVVNVISG